MSEHRATSSRNARATSLESALKELNRFDEALASYEKAIALKPNFAKALFGLGNL